jgi:hypothetical protein
MGIIAHVLELKRKGGKMTTVTVFYGDLNDQTREKIRAGVRRELIEDKRAELSKLYDDSDDWVDSEIDNYIDNGLDRAIDDYINRNDTGTDVTI